MATVITKSSARMRTQVKYFTDASLANIETAYEAFEESQSEVGTETWSVRTVQAYYDPTASKHVLVVEVSYIEKADDNITTLPIT